MTNIIWLDIPILFIRWTIPVITILSLILFLKPKLFVNLEKKLSAELGAKALSRKTVTVLEKENLFLQEALIRNSRIVGLLCFVLTIVIIVRLF